MIWPHLYWKVVFHEKNPQNISLITVQDISFFAWHETHNVLFMDIFHEIFNTDVFDWVNLAMSKVPLYCSTVSSRPLIQSQQEDACPLISSTVWKTIRERKTLCCFLQKHGFSVVKKSQVKLIAKLIAKRDICMEPYFWLVSGLNCAPSASARQMS